MNAAKEIIQVSGFKVVGSSDEGKCDRCGKEGLKRTVAIQAVDADGLGFSMDVEHWGVCCAAYARYGNRAARNQNAISAEARKADADRAAAIAWELRCRARRIATSLHIEIAPWGLITFPCLKQAANRLYSIDRQPLDGSYFATNAQGHIVRVNGSDAADVAFYTERGFQQITTNA